MINLPANSWRRLQRCAILLWAVLLIVPVSGDCPPDLAEKKVVSVKCFQNHALLEIEYKALVAAAGVSAAESFTGLIVTEYVAPPDPEVSVDLPPVISSELLSYQTSYITNNWSPSDENGVTILKKSFRVEMVWPLQPSGQPYQWIVHAECQFQNNQLIKSAILTIAAVANSTTVQITEATVYAPSNEPIAVGEEVTFELQIPNTTNAHPYHCGLTTAPTALSSTSTLAALNASTENCIFYENGGSVSESVTRDCQLNPAQGTTYNLTYPGTTPDKRVFSVRWTAFKVQSVGDNDVLSAFCIIETCADSADPHCSRTGVPDPGQAQSGTSGRAASARWFQVITAAVNIMETPATIATVIPANTSAPPSVSPGPAATGKPLLRSTAKEICLNPAELGSALGVPLVLILILICSLIYLIYCIDRQNKRNIQDAHPTVTVSADPVRVSRPQVLLPTAFGPSKGGDAAVAVRRQPRPVRTHRLTHSSS
ncbi:hypothetical protein BV898_10851 [Hypsibius exemplaris]|uniref:ZP domain-containing protein n=1 Tax=Hypsibius exemplaris TaxID=2072580 RepID=A0A1W0WID9_HYPEX|nr:hypothetical protein BV898_10851 [Hypsibius exemplaris]